MKARTAIATAVSLVALAPAAQAAHRTVPSDNGSWQVTQTTKPLSHRPLLHAASMHDTTAYAVIRNSL